VTPSVNVKTIASRIFLLRMVLICMSMPTLDSIQTWMPTFTVALVIQRHRAHKCLKHLVSFTSVRTKNELFVPVWTRRLILGSTSSPPMRYMGKATHPKMTSLPPGSFVPEFVEDVLHVADGLQPQLQGDTSVTRQQLQLALKEVDKAMLKARDDVAQISTSHIQEFEQGYAMARHLHDRIVEYYRGETDAIQTVFGPDGLKTALNGFLDEHSQVKSQLQQSQNVIHILESLESVSVDLSKFEDVFSSGELDVAVLVANGINQRVQDLPTDINIAQHLVTKAKDITAQLDTRLEEMLNKAWTFDEESLTVHATDLSTILDALSELPSESVQHHLQPFARNLSKIILQPLVKSGTITQAQHRLEVAAGDDWTKLPVGALYEALEQTLGFVQLECLQNRPDFIKYIGNTFWLPLSKKLTQEYLEPLVPEDVKRLQEFDVVSMRTSQFEDLMSERGWIPNSHNMDLQRYCRNVDHQFVNKKQANVLAHVRDNVARDSHSQVQVGQASPYEAAQLHKIGIVSNQNGWKVHNAPVSVDKGTFESFSLDLSSTHPDMQQSLFAFPNCTISQSTLEVLDAVEQILWEAHEAMQQQAETARTTSNDMNYISNRLVVVSRSILDLYRSLVPLKFSKEIENVPAVAMQLHNDAMFLAHECLTLGVRWQPLLPKAVFSDLVLDFRRLGEAIFSTQITKQRGELLAILRAGEGFDALDVDRKESMDRVMRQVAFQLMHLARVWKPILPQHILLKALGKLANACMMECNAEVESLQDISEDECGRITEVLDNLRSGILKLIVFAADIAGDKELDPVTVMRAYIASYDKFVLLSEVLNSSFADIMERFRRGEISEHFSTQQLVSLIKALFLDTPLRQRNLAEIAG
jgi:hypothetical protein